MTSKKELLEEFEGMTDEQLAQLSPEELNEIESILQAPDTAPEEPDAGKGAAFAAGAAQGLTFGTADEIGAAIKTASTELPQSVFSDDPRFMDADDRELQLAAHQSVKSEEMQGKERTLSSLGEEYSKNVKEFRSIFDHLEERNNVAFTAGDVSGSIVSALYTGGTGALFGAGAKTGLKTLGIGALQGAAHGYGRGEGNTIDQDLQNAGIGAGVDILVSGVGGGIGLGITKAAPGVYRRLGAESFVNYLGAHLSPIYRKMNTSLAKYGKNVTDWAERMTGYTTVSKEGKKEALIHGGRRPEELKELFLHEQKVVDSQIESVMGSLPPLQKNESLSLYKTIRTDVLGDRAKKTGKLPEAEQELREFSSWIDEVFFIEKPTGKIIKNGDVQEELLEKVPIERNLQDWQFAKVNINRRELGDTAISGMKKKTAKIIHDYIESGMESSKHLTPDEKVLWKKSMQKWGDLEEGMKVLKLKEKQGSNPLLNIFNQYVTRNSLLAAGLSATMGASPLVAMVTAQAIEKIATSRQVASNVSTGLFRLAENFKKNPKAWESTARKILSAASVSSDAFEDALINADAEMDLKSEPLARTTDEVIRRKDAILTKLDQANPELANNLRKAIQQNDRDGIAGIMAALAESSKEGTIQEGVGWDGHAVTEAEVQKVQSWISGITDVRKRSNLSKQFEADRKLPEEFLQGGNGQTSPSQFIFQKARDKVRNPEY